MTPPSTSSQAIPDDAAVRAGARPRHGEGDGTPEMGRTRPMTVIAPSTGWQPLDLRGLWRARELIGFLAWRDVSVRYKQTALGAGWAIIQPFFTMVVFSLFFGRLAKIPSNDVPYPIFSYCALLPWQFFAYVLGESARSMVTNQLLISRVSMPRIAFPVSVTIAGLVDFTIASTVLGGMMAYYKVWPTVDVVFLPFFLLLVIITALGVGLWLSSLAVQYRDIPYMIPFLLQFWLFITPIAYPTNLVPEDVRWLLGLNPMAGVVDGFRWALLGTDTGPSPMMAVSVVVAVLLFVSGLYYFRRTEDHFADRI
jgi:lipopolysaccharide transport system permease protein